MQQRGLLFVKEIRFVMRGGQSLLTPNVFSVGPGLLGSTRVGESTFQVHDRVARNDRTSAPHIRLSGYGLAMTDTAEAAAPATCGGAG